MLTRNKFMYSYGAEVDEVIEGVFNIVVWRMIPKDDKNLLTQYHRVDGALSKVMV